VLPEQLNQVLKVRNLKRHARRSSVHGQGGQ
jgi:hypothetical protein